MARRHRGWIIAVIVLSLLVLTAVILAAVADEPFAAVFGPCRPWSWARSAAGIQTVPITDCAIKGGS